MDRVIEVMSDLIVSVTFLQAGFVADVIGFKVADQQKLIVTHCGYWLGRTKLSNICAAAHGKDSDEQQWNEVTQGPVSKSKSDSRYWLYSYTSMYCRTMLNRHYGDSAREIK